MSPSYLPLKLRRKRRRSTALSLAETVRRWTWPTTARLRRPSGRDGTRLSHRGRQTAGRAIVIFTQWDRKPVIGNRACVSSCRRERKWGMTIQIPERLHIQPPRWGAITRIARVSFRNKSRLTCFVESYDFHHCRRLPWETRCTRSPRSRPRGSASPTITEHPCIAR